MSELTEADRELILCTCDPDPRRNQKHSGYCNVQDGVHTMHEDDRLLAAVESIVARVRNETAERIAAGMTAWADEIEPGDQWLNFPVTPGEIRAKRDEWCARAEVR
jgi:hypothetical protein